MRLHDARRIEKKYVDGPYLVRSDTESGYDVTYFDYYDAGWVTLRRYSGTGGVWAESMHPKTLLSTTDAIESIQVQLRKITGNRGAFPNPGVAREILHLAIERISKRWRQPVRDWVAALNHFSVVIERRVPESKMSRSHSG